MCRCASVSPSSEMQSIDGTMQEDSLVPAGLLAGVGLARLVATRWDSVTRSASGWMKTGGLDSGTERVSPHWAGSATGTSEATKNSERGGRRDMTSIRTAIATDKTATPKASDRRRNRFPEGETAATDSTALPPMEDWLLGEGGSIGGSVSTSP